MSLLHGLRLSEVMVATVAMLVFVAMIALWMAVNIDKDEF